MCRCRISQGQPIDTSTVLCLFQKAIDLVCFNCLDSFLSRPLCRPVVYIGPIKEISKQHGICDIKEYGYTNGEPVHNTNFAIKECLEGGVVKKYAKEHLRQL